MTTNADAFMAGVDAAILDNTLNRGGFADAVRTVATINVSDAEAKAWIDAIATEYERLGIINNATYGALRSEVISEGATVARALFEALATTINAMPEDSPINFSVRKTDLRAERDEVDGNITTLQGLKTGQPKQVKEAIDLGINELRGHKERVKTELVNLGDPP